MMKVIFAPARFKVQGFRFQVPGSKFESTLKSGYTNYSLAKAQFNSNLNFHDLKVVAIDNQLHSWFLLKNIYFLEQAQGYYLYF